MGGVNSGLACLEPRTGGAVHWATVSIGPPMSDPSFDFSLIGQIAAAMEQAPRGPRYEPLPEGTFPAASLTRWMEAALAAGVPVVPAEVVGTARIDDVLQFDTPEKEGVKQTMATLDAANAMVDGQSMLRWDCCAGYGVKASLGVGSSICTGP